MDTDTLSCKINQMFPVEKDDIGAAKREGPYVAGYYVNWFTPLRPNGRLGYTVRDDIPFVRCSVRTPTGEVTQFEVTGSLSAEQNGQFPVPSLPSPHYDYSIWADGVRELQKKIRSVYPDNSWNTV